MIVYKIQRKSDGKFSGGGGWPKFGPMGKSWRTLTHVREHLRVVRDWKHLDLYEGCKIIPFDLKPMEPYAVEDLLKELS